MSRTKIDDFKDSEVFSSRLLTSTHIRMATFCQRKSIILWRWLDKIVSSALDQEEKAKK